MEKFKNYWNLMIKITEEQWVVKVLLGYLSFIVIYTIAFACTGGEKRLLTSNELGDFLAGTFAAPAFFILILGYIQQGKELQQNTAALKLQADELRATNATLVLQTEELQKNVEHQGQLVLINQQEVDAKHFAAKPFLTFRGEFFRYFTEPFDIEDENDQQLGTIDRYFAEFNFIIENKGEIAKQISVLDTNKNYVWQLYEIEKNTSQGKTITLYDEEAERINKEENVLITYLIQFFDLYGKEYNKTIECEIFYDEIHRTYGVYIKSLAG